MNNIITAELAIKAQIILDSGVYPIDDITRLTAEELQDLWDDLYNGEAHDDLYAYLYDWRSSGVETDLPTPVSRHYEPNQVAAQTPFGWVSWTYWHGGGKHSNPEEIDWIEHAFFVDVTEKEETIITRTFTKKE